MIRMEGEKGQKRRRETGAGKGTKSGRELMTARTIGAAATEITKVEGGTVAAAATTAMARAGIGTEMAVGNDGRGAGVGTGRTGSNKSGELAQPQR